MNSKLLPQAGNGRLVVSFNVCALFHRKLETPKAGPSWELSSPIIEQALKDVDVAALQEVDQPQLKWFRETFGESYSIFALAPTASDVPMGLYVRKAGGADDTSAALTPLEEAKNIGTALVVTLIHKRLQINSTTIFAYGDCNWYSSDAAIVPTDNTKGDKGFGNVKSIRGALGVFIKETDGTLTAVYNTHLPLSGGLVTRSKCLEQLCDHVLKDGCQDHVVAGDMNLFDVPGELLTSAMIRNRTSITLKEQDISRHPAHEGSNGTFLGYVYDTYQNPIKSVTSSGHVLLKDNHRLDLLVVDPHKILSCGTVFLFFDADYEKRLAASDHAMLWAVLDMQRS